MADYPARRDLDPADEETGWGSPMPAEYGSLTAFLPPLHDHPVDDVTRAAERRAGSRQAAPRARAAPRRWRSRRSQPAPEPAPTSPPPRPNGPTRSWAEPAPASDTPDGRDTPAPTAAPTSNGPVRSWAEPAPASDTPDGRDTPAAPTSNGPVRPGANRAPSAADSSTPAARGATDAVADPAPPPARPGSRPPAPDFGVPQADGIAVVPAMVPVETERPAAPGPSEPTPVEEPAPREMPEAHRKRRPRAQWAQSSRTVRHLDIWTVAKVSFFFYVLFFAAVVVASVMLWYVANAVGAIQSIEKSVRTLFDLSKFTLHPSEVAAYTSAGGGVLAIVGTLGNILAALMYNLISDLVGGIRFKVVDEVK